MFWAYIVWIKSWFYKPRYQSSFWYFAEKYRLKFLVLPAIFLLYWLFLEIRIRRFKRIRNELLILQRDTERRLDFYRKDIFLRYSQFQDLTLSEYDDEESEPSIDKENDSEPWCMCASSVQFSTDEHLSVSELKAMESEGVSTKGVHWKKDGDPDGDARQRCSVPKSAKRTRSASESEKDLLQEEPPLTEKDKPKERRKSAPGRYKVIKRTTTETWSEERITRRPICMCGAEAYIRRKRTSPATQEEYSRRRTDRSGEREGAVYRSKSDYGSGKEPTDVEDFPDDEDRNTDDSDSYRVKEHKDESDISTEEKKRANRYEKGKDLRDERNISNEKKNTIRYEKGNELKNERDIPTEEKKRSNRHEKGKELTDERDIPTEEKKKPIRYEKAKDLSDERDIPTEEKKKAIRHEKGKDLSDERSIPIEEKKKAMRYEKGKDLSDERDIPIEEKKKATRYEKGKDLSDERDIPIEEKKKAMRYEKGKDLRDERNIQTDEKKKATRYEKGKDLRDERDIPIEEKKKAMRYEKGKDLRDERNIQTEEKKKATRYEKGKDLRDERDIPIEEKKKAMRYEKGKDLNDERDIPTEEKKKAMRYEKGKDLRDERVIPIEERKKAMRYEKGKDLKDEREISTEEKKNDIRHENVKDLRDERDIPTEEKKKAIRHEKVKDFSDESDILTEEKKKAIRHEKVKDFSDERDILTEEKKKAIRHEKVKDFSDERDIPTEEKKKAIRHEKVKDFSDERDILTEEKKKAIRHEKGKDLSDESDIPTEEKKNTNRYEKENELSDERDILTEEKKMINRYEKGKDLREVKNFSSKEERRTKEYEKPRGYKEEKRSLTEEETRSERRRTDYDRGKDHREGRTILTDWKELVYEFAKDLRGGKERAPEEKTAPEEGERPIDRNKLDHDRKKVLRDDRDIDSASDRTSDKESVNDDRQFPLQKRSEVRKDDAPMITPGMRREDEDFPRPGTFQEKRKEFINLIHSAEEARKAPEARTSIKSDQPSRVQEKEFQKKVSILEKTQPDLLPNVPNADEEPSERISDEELIRSIDFDALKEKPADIPQDRKIVVPRSLSPVETKQASDTDGEYKSRREKKDTSCETEAHTATGAIQTEYKCRKEKKNISCDTEFRTKNASSQTECKVREKKDYHCGAESCSGTSATQSGCGDPDCGNKCKCLNKRNKNRGSPSSRGSSGECRTVRPNIECQYSRTNTYQQWSKSSVNPERSPNTKPNFLTDIEINITENKVKDKGRNCNHPRQWAVSSSSHRSDVSKRRRSSTEESESERFLRPPLRKDEKEFSRYKSSSADIGYILPRDISKRRGKGSEDSAERRRRREGIETDISRNDLRVYPKSCETSDIESKPSSDGSARQADSASGRSSLENKCAYRRRCSEPDGGRRFYEDERKNSERGRQSR